ncbi:MAG TPA: DUF928 domain-containing protein [Nitrospira sp.]|nr:DUF928 domain-containing protein [Nitrospira sp.]
MKCIRLTTTVLIVLFVLAAPFSVAANAEKPKNAAQNEDKTKIPKQVAVPVYKPPVRGAPGGRVGGGTRTDGQTYRISVLAPSHTGQTIHEQPVLFWYLSKAMSTPIEFTLVEPGVAQPSVETVLQPPFQPGIHSVRLADFGVRLVPGKAYRWFVAFVVNSERRSKDILAGGTIERIEPSSTLMSKLAEASKTEMPYVYAEAGLWYDAILAVSDLIEAAPSESGFRKERAALLDQVGLSDIALADLGAKALE